LVNGGLVVAITHLADGTGIRCDDFVDDGLDLGIAVESGDVNSAFPELARLVFADLRTQDVAADQAKPGAQLPF
jgi:hypothetical protein